MVTNLTSSNFQPLWSTKRTETESIPLAPSLTIWTSHSPAFILQPVTLKVEKAKPESEVKWGNKAAPLCVQSARACSSWEGYLNEASADRAASCWLWVEDRHKPLISSAHTPAKMILLNSPSIGTRLARQVSGAVKAGCTVSMGVRAVSNVA